MHTQPAQNMGTFKSDYSEVNGIKMYYEIHGSTGDFLVLIHGGGSTIGTTFSRILPLLAKKFQVIAVELQAHGHTSDRNSPETFEQDADDVVALLHKLPVFKASFFGFSNGGNTAMQIAMRHPEMVNKLVLASTFYKREGFPPGFFEGMKQATINDMPQSLKDAFLEINPDHNSLLAMFTKDRDRMVQFKDWEDEAIRGIKAPALIMNGDRDVIHNGHALAMANLMENSRLIILPSEHGGYIGVAESPAPLGNMVELVVEIISDFLSNRS